MKYEKVSLILLILAVPVIAAAQFYASGPSNVKEFSLTYDDGPAPLTQKLLDLLKERNVKATFFVLGEHVKSYPDAVKRAIAEGHELGCHTYSHKNFYVLDKKPGREETLKKELDLFEKEFEALKLPRPRLLRMPNGFSRQWARDIVFRRGYAMVNWTFGCDWEKIEEGKMTASYIRALKPGAIILLHDGGRNKEKTLRITSAILDEAEKKGLRPVTLSSLLKLK